MHVAEFTLHAKPGHFEQVAEIYSEFASFNDRVGPLLASPSERVEHIFCTSTPSSAGR